MSSTTAIQSLSGATPQHSERVQVKELLQERFMRAMQAAPREPDRSALPHGLYREAPTPPSVDAQSVSQPMQRASHDEVSSLLQRFCSALYVSEHAASLQSRVLLDLEAVPRGASVEVAREGAVLRVRLRARTDEAYYAMLSEREVLSDALAKSGGSQVSVEVVRHDGETDGRSA